MSKETRNEQDELSDLYRGLTALGNRVESLFADCVLALVEQDKELANTLLEDNVRTRDCWLQLDKNCTEMMCAQEISEWKAWFLSAAIKIGMDMKKMADESFAILKQMDNLSGAGDLHSEFLERMPRMAELTQDMLSDSIKALVNKDPGKIDALKLLHKELSSLNTELFEDITRELAAGKTSPKSAVSQILIARTLERVGDYALDISNHVRHIYSQKHVEIPPAES